MKSFTVLDYRKFFFALLLAVSAVLVNNPQIFAHGGEDHGDAKPKTTASSTGTISHTSRLGDYEIMIKHSLFLPDTATLARLFVTEFATNEPVESAEPAVEIESAAGAVTNVQIEKSNSLGSYNIKIPALAEGTYTLRAKLTYKGATDSVTFAGVRVAHPATETEAGGMSWLHTALLLLVGAILLALFGTLVYFVWRLADESRVGEESAVA